jgi:hypothetical protein
VGIGTIRYLPLGITTDDRWGATRRQRLGALGSVLAVVCLTAVPSADDFTWISNAAANRREPLVLTLRDAISYIPLQGERTLREGQIG